MNYNVIEIATETIVKAATEMPITQYADKARFEALVTAVIKAAVEVG